MWTKKSVLVVGLGIALLFLGMIFRNVELVVIAITIFSAAVIAVPMNRQASLVPKRSMSNEKIFEDSPATIELKLTNEGMLKTGLLEVRDQIPKELELTKGSNYTYLNLRKGETAKIKYTAKAHVKGLYPLGPITIRTYDPFSMFYREQSLDYVSNLTVFPMVRDVKEIYIKSKQPKIYPGEVKVKMPGPGSEFFSIREYVPGDPFKDINWKAYGRKRKLLVNEHERESVSDITIVLDARQASSYGTARHNPHVYLSRVAGTLANFFLKRRDSVGIVIYGDKIMTVRKGGGQKQFYEILTAISSVNPGGSIPLGGIVEEVLPYMPRKSPVIILSPLDEDDSLRKAVSTMMVLECDVTIIAPDTLGFEKMAVEEEKKREESGEKKKSIFESGVEEIDPVAYEVLALEREILVSELRTYGARIINWDPDTPMMHVLMQARNAA